MSHRGVTLIDSDIHILEQRLKGQVENGMNSVLDIAQNISQCCQENEKLKEITRNMMTEFIEMEEELAHQVTALHQIKQMDEESANLTHCLDERLLEMQTHNTIDPRVHPKYREMEDKLEASGSTLKDDEFESLRATLLGSMEEDDVALTQTEVNTKCPYSGKMMTNPVRNTACGHVYDKDPILEHIKARKGRAKCPVGGCTNAGSMDAKKLVEYKDLKKYIDYLNKRKSASSSR